MDRLIYWCLMSIMQPLAIFMTRFIINGFGPIKLGQHHQLFIEVLVPRQEAERTYVY